MILSAAAWFVCAIYGCVSVSVCVCVSVSVCVCEC